ncbi:uncharacterized protein LOC109863349 [Pseudomyrmex gracilis]|uniref:uncharacterized protein LOC109863349 n=1 Tax=Pseudomyrmex gracilis TaxID=219809 RepID=UPI0009958F3A|nr:uncharacterized protein LOC109863349 [Pseudomyrmex gracilis]
MDGEMAKKDKDSILVVAGISKEVVVSQELSEYSDSNSSDTDEPSVQKTEGKLNDLKNLKQLHAKNSSDEDSNWKTANKEAETLPHPFDIIDINSNLSNKDNNLNVSPVVEENSQKRHRSLDRESDCSSHSRTVKVPKKKKKRHKKKGKRDESTGSSSESDESDSTAVKSKSSKNAHTRKARKSMLMENRKRR